ncbi:MAG: hypothetical protein AAGN35_13290 [Bacteroidota bacterium]
MIRTLNFLPNDWHSGLWGIVFVLAKAFSASAQSETEAFFRAIYAQSPAQWYDLNDGNRGRYTESITNGKYVTKHSFLLIDPYATGKSRYLKPLAAKDLGEFLPDVRFFYGELSCNFEFNGGKLPFLGYLRGNTAGIIYHPAYDVLDVPTKALFASALIRRQGQMENFALGLTQLFALLRLSALDCDPDIQSWSKAETKWSGEMLTVKLPFELRCKQAGSTDYGPRTQRVEIEFDFTGGKYTDLTVLTGP